MRRSNLALSLLAVTLLTANSFAGTIDLNAIWNGGNPFQGTNVSYNDVQETNSNGDGTNVGGNYGDTFNHYQFPTVVGNTFIVQPVNLRAEVNPGQGIDFTDSQLSTLIMANQGQTFDAIDFSEFGDYQEFSFAPAGSTVQATLNYFWTVIAGNNAGFSGNGNATFTRTAGPLASGPWSLNFHIDVPGATKVRLTFDNTLTAIADAGGVAFIAKKQIPGIMITVPEPSSAAITSLLGAVVLMVSRRMKSR